MSDLKEGDYDLCHSNDSLTDSSQSSLQTVLVTFRIDKPSAKHIKRVRFNSFVEVKFIPRRRKEKKRQNRLEVEDKEENACVDDAPEKANHEIKPADNIAKETNFKGEASICEQWVSVATGDVSEALQNSDAKIEKAQPSWNAVMKADTRGRTKSAKNEPTKQNSDPAKVCAAAKSRGTVRENYTTNKITLGEDYIGNAMRLDPTAFPITLPIRFSEFLARIAKRQNLQEFGSKAVWKLEKQAVKFCQETEELIRQVTEKSAHIQSKLNERSDTFLLGGNHGNTFSNDFTSFGKPSSMPGVTSLGKPVSQDVFHTKPVTRFPYLNHKKQPQTNIGLSSPSFSELSLPQLLSSDGNGTQSPTARTDGKGENTGNTGSKFGQVKREESTNGKLFIHYLYGSAKKLPSN